MWVDRQINLFNYIGFNDTRTECVTKVNTTINIMKKFIIGFSSILFLAFLWMSVQALKLESKPEHNLDSSSSVLSEEPEEFVLFTMPKTGTHLVRPLLEHLTAKNSISYWSPEVNCYKSYFYDKNMTELLLLLPHIVQAYWLHQPIPTHSFLSVLDQLQFTDNFLVTHAPFSLEMEAILKERNCPVFFLIRDPRDWVISVIKHPPISGVDIYGAPIGDKFFLSLDMNQKIDYVIQGTPWYYSAREVYEKFLPWMKSSVCCTLRFEALLGPQGGAYSEKEQIAELRKIATALHLDVSDEMLLETFQASFGKGTIFSKGKAGSWKDYFNEEHKEHFKQILGDILIELGYEKDNNW